jgi:hypothetical protein
VSRPRLLWLLPALVLVIACGGDPPAKEIEQARSAIDAARTAQADRYAAEEFSAAVSALENASAAVDQHDYRLALNHALDSRERAANATRQAVDAVAIERSKADSMVKAAASALESAHAKVKAPETARVPPRVMASVRTQVAAAEAHLQEARAGIEQRDYAAATAAASAATKAAEESLAALGPATTPPLRRRR